MLKDFEAVDKIAKRVLTLHLKKKGRPPFPLSRNHPRSEGPRNQWGFIPSLEKSFPPVVLSGRSHLLNGSGFSSYLFSVCSSR